MNEGNMRKKLAKVTQRIIDVFTNEIYTKRVEKQNITKKTKVYYIEDTWSLDTLDLKD